MNITKITEEFIQKHPSIKDCIRKNLINYSSLSRRIIKEEAIPEKSFDAILIACRRCAEKVGSEPILEDKIHNLIKKSKLGIKNKIVYCVIEKNISLEKLLSLGNKIKKESESFHLIEGVDSITIVTSEEFLEDIKKTFDKQILSYKKGLIQIIFRSTKDLDDTPGVLAYLLSLFSENNINVIKIMSSWTETIFVIDEKDIAEAMKVLKI